MLRIATYFNHLDWLVFGLLLTMTALVVFIKRRPTTSTHKKISPFMNHLLMGRTLTLPLFVGTLVATWYGAVLGVTQNTFEHGLYNFLTQGVFWYGCYFIFAVFLVKKIHATQAYSLPELVGHLYGKKSAKITAGLILFKTLPISYVLSLGFFIQWLCPFSLFESMAIGLLFVMAYSFFGGFRAIVFTDAIQCVLMCFSVLAVVCCAYCQYGGLNFLTSHLPAHYFHWQSDFSWEYTLVWLWIAIAKTFVNPVFYQRCMAVPKPRIATQGILISIVIWFFFDCCTTLGGLYAKAVLFDANPASAYLQFSLETLPHGLRGFFIAGMIAAILSTLDSYLLISTNTLLSDFKWFNISSFFHRKFFFCLLITTTLTLAFATQFESFESTQRTIGSFLTAVLFGPLLWHFIFPQSIKDEQFVLTAVAVMIFMLSAKWVTWQIDPFYIGNVISLCLLSGLTLWNRRQRNLSSHTTPHAPENALL